MTEGDDNNVPGPIIGWIAEGKLWLQRQGQAPSTADSAFVESVKQRQAKDAERHGWKQNSLGWQATANPYGIPVAGESAGAVVRFTAFDTDASQALTYLLHTSHTSGIFQQPVAGGTESRRFHKQAFAGSDLACHPLDE